MHAAQRLLVLAGFIVLWSPAHGQPPEPVRVLTSHRTVDPPRVDGVLDDPAWLQAEPSQLLVQSYPDPGKPASLRTEIGVLHDDQALYVAARCYDPQPQGIVARVTRRDRNVESDLVQLEIDSRHDRRNS